jgi:hypothetical protein
LGRERPGVGADQRVGRCELAGTVERPDGINVVAKRSRELERAVCAQRDRAGVFPERWGLFFVTSVSRVQ